MLPPFSNWGWNLRRIQGGAITPVEVISDADLEVNGGTYQLLGNTAIRVYGFATQERSVMLSEPLAVYAVSDAQIASGQFKLMGGASLPVIEASLVGITYDSFDVAIPVYLMGGTLGGSSPVVADFLYWPENYWPVTYWPIGYWVH